MSIFRLHTHRLIADYHRNSPQAVTYKSLYTGMSSRKTYPLFS